MSRQTFNHLVGRVPVVLLPIVVLDGVARSVGSIMAKVALPLLEVIEIRLRR